MSARAARLTLAAQDAGGIAGPGLDEVRRQDLVDHSGVAYRDFRRSLEPEYAKAWTELLAGHAGLLLTGAALVAVRRQRAWLPLAVPAGAAAVGFGLAYLHLFLHEAAHFNLAADKQTNDRLANLFIGSLSGVDVATYRRRHFEHHRSLGRTSDPESSYFDALDLRLVFESLTGIKIISRDIFACERE